MAETLDTSKLDNREYLMELVTRHFPQYKKSDLNLFTAESLRFMITSFVKPTAPVQASIRQSASVSPSATVPTGYSVPVPASVPAPAPVPNRWGPTQLSSFMETGSTSGYGSGTGYGSGSGSVSEDKHTSGSTYNPSVDLDNNQPLLILDKICLILDRDQDLLTKVQLLRADLIELSRSIFYSRLEVNLMQRDLQRKILSLITKAYEKRYTEISALINKKCMSPEIERVLCDNQQVLYQLLCQYKSVIQPDC